MNENCGFNDFYQKFYYCDDNMICSKTGKCLTQNNASEIDKNSDKNPNFTFSSSELGKGNTLECKKSLVYKHQYDKIKDLTEKTWEKCEAQCCLNNKCNYKNLDQSEGCIKTCVFIKNWVEIKDLIIINCQNRCCEGSHCAMKNLAQTDCLGKCTVDLRSYAKDYVHNQLHKHKFEVDSYHNKYLTQCLQSICEKKNIKECPVELWKDLSIQKKLISCQKNKDSFMKNSVWTYCNKVCCNNTTCDFNDQFIVKNSSSRSVSRSSCLNNCSYLFNKKVDDFTYKFFKEKGIKLSNTEQTLQINLAAAPYNKLIDDLMKKYLKDLLNCNHKYPTNEQLPKKKVCYK